MPAALPLWVITYALGVWGGAAFALRWHSARWGLVAALLSLGLSCLRDRGKGVALLGCALALGGVAQGRRAAVLEIPARGPGLQRSAAARSDYTADAVDIDVNDLLASAELLPDTQWLCEGRVVVAAVATEHGAALRVAVTALRRADGPTDFARLGVAPAGAAAWLQVRPPLLVAVNVRGQPREPLLPDTPVRLVAPLRSPRAAQNPGAPDRLRHAAAIGIHALASVDPEQLFPWRGPAVVAAPVSPLDRASLPLLRSAAQLRARLLAQIIQALPASPPDPPIGQKSGRAVVAALALGERGLVAQVDQQRHALGLPTIEQSFRGAGIYHVLSVSGLHLAVVAWIFYRLLAWLLLWIPGLATRWAVHRVAAVVALPPTLFYSLLTGAELATQRAAVAAIIGLLAVGCGRRAPLSHALAGAVLAIAFPIALTAGTPALLLCEPALILSLLATAAIAYLQPLGGVPQRLQVQSIVEPGVRPLVRRVLRGAWRLTEGSLAATLVTAPVCAWCFSELQLGGVLGNLLPGLLGELVVLPLGLFGALLGLVSQSAGALILSGAITAAAAMVRSAAAIAQLAGVVSVPAPHPLLALLWWLGLGLVALGRRRGYWITAAALGGYLLLWQLPSRELRVTVLDVGQGDAIVVELPAGGVMVIDAGLATPLGVDMGARVVVPFLRRRGYRRIDIAVASHPHPDHTGGLTALLESFPVGELWVAPPPATDGAAANFAPPTAMVGAAPRARSRPEAQDPSWLQLLSLAAQRGVTITAPHSLRLQGVTVEVLAPCRSGPDKACVVATHADWQHNDNSVVLRLGYGGRTILLPGDIELDGELAILDRFDDPDRPADRLGLRADVLKAAHHCSRTSSSESLVAAVQPQWVVCSVGAYNRYRFPHPEVTARYLAIGSQVLRTDADGAIEVRINAAGNLRVTTPTEAR